MFNWLSNFFRDKKTPTRPDKGEVDTSSGASVQAVIVVFGEEDLGNGARFLTHVLEAKPAEVAFTLVGRQEDHARLSNLAAYITRQVAMMGHICLGQIEFAKVAGGNLKVEEDAEGEESSES